MNGVRYATHDVNVRAMCHAGNSAGLQLSYLFTAVSSSDSSDSGCLPFLYRVFLLLSMS